MDFIDQLRALAGRCESTRCIIETEEATKTSMIMPFIQLLGYNVFDPREVVPEFVADVGTKKGEKIDYAILKDGKPIILMECKKCGSDLNINHASQLFRYFHVAEARFGILTNGIVYRFFTDLDKANKMDEKSFMDFNMLEFRDTEVEELKKFTKSAFDVEKILATANELKYTSAIIQVITDWIANPSEELVKLAASEFLVGRRFVPALKEQFTEIVKNAFRHVINNRIQVRLKAAMSSEAAQPDEKIPAPVVEENDKTKIVTTETEIEGFHIVRAILRETVPAKRIAMRDTISYCSVILDENNRKPIVRMRFNNPERLVLGFVDGKNEERIVIEDLDAIYQYADRLKAKVAEYEGGKQAEELPDVEQ